MRLKPNILFLTTILLFSSLFSVQAEIPHNINYQGCLTDDTGTLLPDGAYLLKFIIYGSAAGSDELWNSDFQAITVGGGVFTYLLGSNVAMPADLFDSDSTRYLGITIGADPESIPRTKITSVAFAFHAGSADNINPPLSLTADNDIKPIISAHNTGDGAGIYGESDGGDAGYFSGTVHITKDLTIDGKLYANGVGDITSVTTGSGLSGGATSGTANVYIPAEGVTTSHIDNYTIVNNDISDTANIDPTKIDGTAAVLTEGNTFTATNYFEKDIIAEEADLVFRSNTKHRWRLEEKSTTGLQFNQVYADGGPLLNKTRLELFDDGSVGIGGYDSTTKVFIKDSVNTTDYLNSALKVDYSSSGYNTLTAGIQSRLYGYNNSTEARSIYGIVSSDSFTRIGVCGIAQAMDFDVETGKSYGVLGYAYDGATSYGIYASGASALVNWAGYFSGNVRVTGTLDNSKSIMRIDHPLDPENKVLEHAGINSPEMLNVYSGNISTDKNGEAVVILPDYFDALNSDCRYQLTVIGSFAQAIIKQEVSGNHFIIATSEPQVKVSWQITGVRTDAFANQYPVNVESEKKAEEMGYFINPSAFGFDQDRSLEYISNSVFRDEFDNRKGK